MVGAQKTTAIRAFATKGRVWLRALLLSGKSPHSPNMGAPPPHEVSLFEAGNDSWHDRQERFLRVIISARPAGMIAPPTEVSYIFNAKNVFDKSETTEEGGGREIFTRKYSQNVYPPPPFFPCAGVNHHRQFDQKYGRNGPKSRDTENNNNKTGKWLLLVLQSIPHFFRRNRSSHTFLYNFKSLDPRPPRLWLALRGCTVKCVKAPIRGCSLCRNFR